MRLSLSLLVPLVPLLSLPFASAQTDLECPNADLTSYLLQLIDALYANGLTTFEALLADITGTDAGYELLSSIFASNGTTTLLVPTDAAFQLAGVWAPFGQQSKEYLVDLFGLHSIQGHWGHNELPETGMGVGKSMMAVKKDNAGAGWAQNVVMKRGERGQVVLKTAFGDVTSWSGPAHLEGYNLLDNVVILPIDHVIPLPPNISVALTLPTTTRSDKGLPQLETAFKAVSPTGADALTAIMPGGLTFFAPVDDAWTAEVWAQVEDKGLAPKLMGNHYSTSSAVFSPDWTATGAEVTIMTGQKLVLSTEGETYFVSLGDQKAQILRSDIVLENGILHIIDKVFLVTDAQKTTAVSVRPHVGNEHVAPVPNAGVPGVAPAPPIKTSDGEQNLQAVSTAYWVTMAGLVVWYAVGQ